MRALLVFTTLIWATSAHARDAIWIEGEDAFDDSFNNNGWYSSVDVSLDLLSPGIPGEAAGSWLSHFADGEGAEPVEAVYAFDLAEAGPHDVWIRACDYSAGNSFWIDGGDPMPIPQGQNNENVNLHVNRAATEGGWIDIRFQDWIYLGEHDLGTGRHSLTIRVESVDRGNGSFQASIGIDAIAIVNFPWGPSGTLQPQAEPGPEPAADDWFPFLHADLAPSDVAIDVSALVEAPTGQHGALQRNGSDYQFEDGTPVKFWGVGAAIPVGVANMERQAKFLRRLGINLIRLHPLDSYLGPLITPPDGGAPYFDPERLEQLDRYTAIMGEHGIYMQWSVFWFQAINGNDGYDPDLYAELEPTCGANRFGCYYSADCVRITAENSVVCDGDNDCPYGSDELNCDGTPDPSGRRDTYGYVNVSRGIQDIRMRYLETLLDHTNPHTGVRYADDPTLAILEVQNEDSIFFYAPLNGLAGPQVPLHSAAFRTQFAAWVKDRYETDEALAAAWGEGLRAGDSVDADELAVFGGWEQNSAGPENQTQRARHGDFLRFCADLQIGFWNRRQDAVRALGFKGVTVGTGWWPGGPAADAAMVYTESALDSIDRHGYFGGYGSWRATLGEFTSGTILDLSDWYDADREQDWLTPFEWTFLQVEDRPFGMSEWSHGAPGEFRAEGAPIYAFYGLGLQGWDASLNFAFGGGTNFNTSWDFGAKYRIANPVSMVQYPALATAVHHKHFDEGAPAAARRLTLDQAFAGYDALNQPFDGVWEGAETLTIPPEVFALGRISNKVGDDVTPSERSDWDTGWDRLEETVTANTGQLFWNYGEKYFEARSTKTQGVVGFAEGKTLTLPDVTITMGSEYASLLVTALDNRPLNESGRVLVTAVAREKWTGSVIERTGAMTAEMRALGGPPLIMEPVQATLSFNTPFETAKALDHQGRDIGRALPAEEDGSYKIDGRYATLYYLFEREPVGDPDPIGAGGAMGAGGATGESPGADTDDEAEGCGCDASDRSEDLGSGLLLVLLLGLTRRRRR